MRVLHFFVISLALMLPIDYLLAQDHDGINLVGEMYDWSLSGVHDLEIRGDYAFVADGTSAFQVLYIGDSDEFKIAGQISDIGGAPVAVAIQDTLAFLAVENQGLTIIDISDPPDPQIISFINRPGPIIDVAVNDQFACLLGTELWVIAIDNPSRPGILGSVRIHDGREVLLDGNFVYVANDRGDPDVFIIDLEDPSNPNIVQEFEMGSVNDGISLRDEYLYCVGRSDLKILDISDPFEVEIIGEADGASGVSKICVNEQFAFCVGSRGLRIYSIENPAEPNEVAYHGLFVSELEPQIVENTLYMPMGRNGINIYNVEDVEEPVELNPEISRHSIEKVQFNNNLIYLIDNTKILRILDFTNPDRMVELGSMSVEGDILNLLVQDDYAYISTRSEGVIIADVSQPHNPQIVAQHRTQYPVFDVMIRGLDAYILESGEEEEENVVLYRMNIENPSNPRNITWINSWDRYQSPAIRTDGSNIFVALNPGMFEDDIRSGVGIIDMAVDSLRLIDIGDGITDIEIYGNILAVAKGSGHISLIDISDIDDVRRLTSFGVSRSPVSDIKLTSRYIYAAALGNGIKIYDITDPVRPRRVGYYDTEGLASSIDVLDHMIVVGDINNLSTYDCDDCTDVTQIDNFYPGAFTILEAYPNPFNSTLTTSIRLPFESPVSIDVYNLQGKLVHNLYGESPLSAGSHKLIWNAMGLTSGTYFLTIRSNGISETKSVELIK